MTKREEIREGVEKILTEDLILCSITHENAPPFRDCYEDCGVLKDRDGNPIGKRGKHKKCMDCWGDYVKDLTGRILAVGRANND